MHGHARGLQPGRGLTALRIGTCPGSAGPRTCRLGCDHSWLPSLPAVLGPVPIDTCPWEPWQNWEFPGTSIAWDPGASAGSAAGSLSEWLPCRCVAHWAARARNKPSSGSLGPGLPASPGGHSSSPGSAGGSQSRAALQTGTRGRPPPTSGAACFPTHTVASMGPPLCF